MIPKPTFDQEKIVIEKTIRHIRFVQDNMKAIALHGGVLGVSHVDIMRRAFFHDFSKFDNSIYEGYVWYHLRNIAIEEKKEIPEYSDELNDYIFDCVKKHRSQSRHHPEYYADINDMEPLDIIEMVCDWAAVSQEFKMDTYKGSRDFANATIGTKYMFDEKHKDQIFNVISLLGELNGKEW